MKKVVIGLAALCVTGLTTAEIQKIQYAYDDSDAEYSIVSFSESDTAIQAIVQRAGTYFTSYTKVELDCPHRNVRHMGMYNSLESLEKAPFDQMQGRIVEGSIADEVGKLLCKGTLTASQAGDLSADEQANDRS
ncbi:hypothetical protein [Pseudomonas citri]|uniref:hypothetical protein n=1 Tax=Pseudomonas citri TaxID=2978349 RepID=UPI0021B68894|nr:hypothetical protein [Pseudomonas citri]